jgi:hypothetical protein
MSRSPLIPSLFYLIIGCMFIIFAVHEVKAGGWGFFSYLLVLLATLDLGAGLKMVFFYIRYKDQLK